MPGADDERVVVTEQIDFGRILKRLRPAGPEQPLDFEEPSPTPAAEYPSQTVPLEAVRYDPGSLNTGERDAIGAPLEPEPPARESEPVDEPEKPAELTAAQPEPEPAAVAGLPSDDELRLGLEAGALPEDAIELAKLFYRRGQQSVSLAAGSPGGSCWYCGQRSTSQPSHAEQVRIVRALHDSKGHESWQWSDGEWNSLERLLDRLGPTAYLAASRGLFPPVMMSTVRLVANGQVLDIERHKLRERCYG